MRPGAGGDQELIVRFLEGFPAGMIIYLDPLRDRVDSSDFMSGANIDVELFAKCFWRPGDQVLVFVDQAADQVRHPAGRIGRVPGFFKNQDVPVGLLAPDLRCC